jgi:sterol desaturase/sphingolipid hydroxylase (fatty acid hydroxylase superfamily)
MCVVLLLYVAVVACFFPSAWTWLSNNSSNLDDDDAEDDGTLFNAQRLRFALISTFWLEVIFWTAQSLLLLITRNPELFTAWTIKKKHVSYPSKELLTTALNETLQGHLLRPIFLWLFYPLWAYRGCFDREFPSFFELSFHIFVCMLVDDTLFYWSHRVLHENKYLYRTIHKQHHEFRYSVGLATEYAHPLEDIFSNTIPTVAGALLLGSHVSIAVGYMGIKLWQSVDGHSGMALPFPLSPWNNQYIGMDCALAHDYHHSHNSGNYGGYFIWWDWLCGTDKAYRRYQKKMLKKAAAAT